MMSKPNARSAIFTIPLQVPRKDHAVYTSWLIQEAVLYTKTLPKVLHIKSMSHQRGGVLEAEFRREC